ncbi:MAG: hypothetical protein IJ923_06055 [Campylobacter sp.]|nr:hypothetical protein [Campylobacter sp.]
MLKFKGIIFIFALEFKEICFEFIELCTEKGELRFIFFATEFILEISCVKFGATKLSVIFT